MPATPAGGEPGPWTAFDAAGIACPNGRVMPVFVRAGRAVLAAFSFTMLAAGCEHAGPAGGGAPTAPAPSPSAPATAAPRQTVDITVVGTSDLHGRLSTLPYLAGYVGVLRAKNPGGVVLVDAGDMFQGTLESNTNEGAAVIDAYKALGYDAVTIGNHEFDFGPVGPASTPAQAAKKEGPESDARGAIKARAAQAKGAFPMLAATILEDGHPLSWPNVVPSIMVEKHGIPVGIIGVSTMQTPATTLSANVHGITMKPIVEAITEQARALRAKGAKVIVVAAHAGGQCANVEVPTDLSSCDQQSEIFQVARGLPPGLVQVIIAAHTHKAIAQEVAGTPVLEANAYGTHFDLADIVVDAKTGEVVSTRIHPPEPVQQGGSLAGVSITPVPAVEAAVAPAIEAARSARARPLGVTLTAPFEAKYREESSLGDLVTSLLLSAEPKADIAVANGGGLRADLPAGPLTYGSLYDALPFDNKVARLTMTGRALRETVAKNLTSKGGILSLAGARVAGKCEGGALAVDIYLTGPKKKGERLLRDQDKVRIVTNEFLATRGDDFGPGQDVEIEEAGPALRDVVAGVIEKRKGELRPEDWYAPGKPRIALPGPSGPDICKGK